MEPSERSATSWRWWIQRGGGPLPVDVNVWEALDFTTKLCRYKTAAVQLYSTCPRYPGYESPRDKNTSQVWSWAHKSPFSKGSCLQSFLFIPDWELYGTTLHSPPLCCCVCGSYYTVCAINPPQRCQSKHECTVSTLRFTPCLFENQESNPCGDFPELLFCLTCNIPTLFPVATVAFWTWLISSSWENRRRFIRLYLPAFVVTVILCDDGSLTQHHLYSSSLADALYQPGVPLCAALLFWENARHGKTNY